MSFLVRELVAQFSIVEIYSTGNVDHFRPMFHFDSRNIKPSLAREPIEHLV